MSRQLYELGANVGAGGTLFIVAMTRGVILFSESDMYCIFVFGIAIWASGVVILQSCEMRAAIQHNRLQEGQDG